MNQRFGTGSRITSSAGSSTLKPPRGFWQKLIRFFQHGFLSPRFLYRKSRQFLWIGTTGLIFLIAPFAFSHFLEVSEELNQISKMGGQQLGRI